MTNDTLWTPPAQKRPVKLTCKKCGQEVSWIPIGKVDGRTVWAPICKHCEKPWTAAELKAAQKQIDNRRVVPLEEYQRRNIGKGEFSLPEENPVAKAFIKATKKDRVFFEGGKNEAGGNPKTASGDTGSGAGRKRAKTARKNAK